MTPSYPQAQPATEHQVPLRGLAALPCPGRCVAALQLDGGTRIMRGFDADMMCGELADLLRRVRPPRTHEEEIQDREHGGFWVQLPVPQLWGPRPLATVDVGGERRHIFRFHVVDTAYIILNVESGKVAIQAKAKALWCEDGWEKWLLRWAALVSWWLGEDVVTMDDIDAQWWVTGVEMCSDFVGVPWVVADMFRVVAPGVPTREAWPAGKPRRRKSKTSEAEADVAREKVHPISRAGEDESNSAMVDTLNIGRRSSNVSWCLYRKTEQILRKKGGDASTYSSMWQAMGWDGEEEITRVEVRLCKRALVQMDEETGEQYDMRVPSALCSRELLAKVWASHTAKYRIVVDHGDKRRRRRDTDPRWKVVQSAASCKARMMQDRAVQGATWREATARAAKAALRSLQRLAAMHGLNIVTPEGYGKVAELYAVPVTEADLPDAQKLLSGYGEKHAMSRRDFLWKEMVAHQPTAPPLGTRKLDVVVFTSDQLPEEWAGFLAKWEAVRAIGDFLREHLRHRAPAPQRVSVSASGLLPHEWRDHLAAAG